MICPYCASNDDKVIDSRASDGGRVIRRRRKCLSCDKRFTTYERVEQTARLIVVKKDGSRVPYEPDKMLAGIKAACGKRPIPESVKRRIVEEVEEAVHADYDREVDSRVIGDKVMRRLRDVDEVAFVRFASEHFQFRTIDELKAQVEELEKRERPQKNQQSLFSADGKAETKP